MSEKTEILQCHRWKCEDLYMYIYIEWHGFVFKPSLSVSPLHGQVPLAPTIVLYVQRQFPRENTESGVLQRASKQPLHVLKTRF